MSYKKVIQMGFDIAVKPEGEKDIENLFNYIEDKINEYYDITQTQQNFRSLGIFNAVNLTEQYEDILEEIRKPKKEKFRVYAVVTTQCYLDVEAESEEEAIKIGEDTDGGDFISQEDCGFWNVNKATKIS